ncbi:hypothetical protein BDZ89DRAFT_1213062 [Hymenopellis radicata]|nr:hypothetical protein BDZ89DRAFT_1213062 [Hymenopellis radicata]
MPCFAYGIILRENASGTYSVQFSTQHTLNAVDPVLICQLPKSLIRPAEKAIRDGASKIVKAFKDASAAEVTIVIGSAAGAGLSGGAATMSGLATLGSIVGGGAVSGVAVVSMGPIATTSKGMQMIVKANENDRTTGNIAAGTCVATGIASSTLGATPIISASGTVIGLSGPGIASGLAAIGGTMLGGVAVIAAASTGVGLVGGLIAWGITSAVRQDAIGDEYSDFIDAGRRLGYQGP